jgi:carbonic anhydrase
MGFLESAVVDHRKSTTLTSRELLVWTGVVNDHPDCSAIVLTCMDKRFHSEISRFMKKEYGENKFYFVSLPGGVQSLLEKKRGASIRALDLAIGSFDKIDIVLINHSDCVAYGGLRCFNHDHNKERNFHRQQLLEARQKVATEYPGNNLRTLFLSFHKDDDLLNIEITEIH